MIVYDKFCIKSKMADFLPLSLFYHLAPAYFTYHFRREKHRMTIFGIWVTYMWIIDRLT